MLRYSVDMLPGPQCREITEKIIIAIGGQSRAEADQLGHAASSPLRHRDIQARRASVTGQPGSNCKLLRTSRCRQ